MLAQTVFPYLAVGAPGFGPGNNGPQGNGPEKYTPLKLGPSGSEPDLVVGPYRPLGWRTWAAGLGGSSSLDGDHGSGTLDTNVGGVAGDIDYRFNSTALLGVAGGYTDSDLSVDSLYTDGNVQGAHVGLYGVKTFGRIYLAGTAEYAHFENETDRVIDFVVNEQPGASSTATPLEVGLKWAGGGTGAVTLSRRSTRGRLPARQRRLENSHNLNGGADILGLTFASDSTTSVTSSLGLQFDTQYALAYDRVLTPFVRVAWVHEYDPDRSLRSFLTASPLASFAVDGASAAGDVALVDAGLKLDLSERIALFGFFEGQFGDRAQSYAGVGGGDLVFAGSGQGDYSGRVGMKVRW
jgi:outer membrane autotransporter protein